MSQCCWPNVSRVAGITIACLKTIPKIIDQKSRVCFSYFIPVSTCSIFQYSNVWVPNLHFDLIRDTLLIHYRFTFQRLDNQNMTGFSRWRHLVCIINVFLHSSTFSSWLKMLSTSHSLCEPFLFHYTWNVLQNYKSTKCMTRLVGRT